MQFEPVNNEPDENGSPLPQLQNEDNDRPQIGRQKAVAAVSNVHPPEMIAKFAFAIKKSNLRVIEDHQRMVAAIMQCLLGSNQEEFCLTNNTLVENEQQLQSQDHSSKHNPLSRHDLSEAATD